ncbi:MAG: SDR family oxidoreductase [Azospirillaceae bacterium]|nr:SDR family oxidoreductase [Azospirillaceae bacterium]
MDLELTGKRVLVTGSTSGIGVGIAELLAAEGAAVVIHGRDGGRGRAVADRLAGRGASVQLVCGDLATDAGAAEVAERAVSALGGIDILVNNAGGSADVPNKSWFALGTSDWMVTYQRNVLAAVRLIHALVPPMRGRGWGRVINIATGAALTPTSAQPDYGPAKAAMLNFSLGLSKAIAKSGVTSNCISPGMIRTEGLEQFLRHFATKRGWGDDLKQAEDYVASGSGQTVRRIGEVADIAYAVAFLASPRADFINGTNLHIDGGITPSIT